MNIDTEQMLTQDQVAKMKDMTLQLLAHHLKRPGAPQPVLIGGRKHYQRDDVKAWIPRRANKNRKDEK